MTVRPKAVARRRLTAAVAALVVSPALVWVAAHLVSSEAACSSR